MEANKLRVFPYFSGTILSFRSTLRRVSVVPPGTNGTHDAYGVARIGFGPRGGDERDVQEHALPHSPTSACTRSSSCSATPRWRMISPNGERDDGEIIAAQPQHRKADGDADNAPYQIITINDA